MINDSNREVADIRYLANSITGLRIVLALSLAWCNPFTLPFYVCFTLCGLTDAIDGPIARKTNSVSTTGALLDTIADMVFVIIAGFKVLPAVMGALSVSWLWVIAGIGAVKLLAYLIGTIRFHRFSALHTIMNKVTGMLLFGFIYLAQVINMEFLFAVIGIVAGVTAIEEVLCMITLKEFNPNIKSIFSIKKRK